MQSQPQPPKPLPLRSGIIFGPGRSTRLPDPGTPAHQELLDRMRIIQSQSK